MVFCPSYTARGFSGGRKNTSRPCDAQHPSRDEHRRIPGCDPHLLCGRPAPGRYAAHPPPALPGAPPYDFACGIGGRR